MDRESALIRRLQSGETEAFDALFEMHRRGLFAYIAGIVRDQHLGEDICDLGTMVEERKRTAPSHHRTNPGTEMRRRKEKAMKCTTRSRLVVALCVTVSLLLGTVPGRGQHAEEGERKERRDREHAERREREEREREGRRERDEDRVRAEREERHHDRERDEGDEPKSFGELVERIAQHLPKHARKDIMEFTHHHFGDVLREAKHIFAEELGEAAEMVEHAFGESMDLIKLQREDPKVFERALRERQLEREAEEMAREAEHAEGKAKEKILLRLKELLSETFDMRQEDMRGEMKELEDELTGLKTLVEKRQKNRDLIIERRAKELTGELDHLEW
jgi:hypothetical protein